MTNGEQEVFKHGNARLKRALADPGLRADVAKARVEMDEADRTHRLGLAAIRKAAEMTQTELAEKLGVRQAAVSAMEGRKDMLLSTLAGYLAAAGATGIRVVLNLNGEQIEYELPQVPSPSA